MSVGGEARRGMSGVLKEVTQRSSEGAGASVDGVGKGSFGEGAKTGDEEGPIPSELAASRGSDSGAGRGGESTREEGKDEAARAQGGAGGSRQIHARACGDVQAGDGDVDDCGQGGGGLQGGTRSRTRACGGMLHGKEGGGVGGGQEH
jgi:hypothetical protein